MLRFSWILLFSAPCTYASLLLGGWWVVASPLVITALMVCADAVWPEDWSQMPAQYSGFYNLFLYAQLPVATLALLLLAWFAAPGDLLGMGARIQAFSGGFLAAHPANWLEKVGAALSVGFLISTNAVVGHELVHRTQSAPAMMTGRWLLAMMGDSQFSISHIYEHHILVGTEQDPATARRSESLYQFMVRSAAGQLRGAYRIEARRLSNTGQPVWSWHNRFLRGQVMTFVIMLGFWLAGGWQALVIYVICASYAKFLYETVNYIQHFGLVRVLHTPIEGRHSWDCRSYASSAFLFSLTRHAHHHVQGEIPYWKVAPSPSSITHPYGYTSAMILATVPPVWRHYTAPRLRYWDTHLASTAERESLQRNTMWPTSQGTDREALQ